jgi:hypothetical protein
MKRGLTTALLIATCSAALAGEPIGRKPGQWEVTYTIFERAVRVAHVCVDDASDSALFRSDWFWGEHDCAREEIKREGGTVTLESACLYKGGTIKRNVTLRLSGDVDFYQYDVANVDPPIYGRSELTIRQAGRWLGPCAAGQKPGDMDIEGKSVNLMSKS